MNKRYKVTNKYFKETTWDEVRLDIRNINQPLFDIIEKISPSKSYKLYEVAYPFGQNITRRGSILLPCGKENSYVEINDSRLPGYIRNELNYSTTPLIMQFDNKSELYLDIDHRIIPLDVFYPGKLYGLFEAITPLTKCPVYPTWDVSSGARSVFLLPKVTDAIFHSRLKYQYHLSDEVPKKLSDQWSIFKQIINSQFTTDDWCTRIIIFGKSWFNPRKKSVAWLEFEKYLLIHAWQQAQFRINKLEISKIWELFSTHINKLNFKNNIYLIDTLKHLIAIVQSTVPGFIATNGNNDFIPSQLIEQAYLDVYRLKEYYPTIMTPTNFDLVDDSIYYSLAYPTLIETSISSRSQRSVVAELRQLKTLVDIFQKIVKEQTEVPKYYDISHINFEYFHPNKDKFGTISDSKIKLGQDKEICPKYIKKFKKRTFSMSSPFLTGCVKISK